MPQWFSAGPRQLADFKVFDEATRGPMGATKLMVNPRIMFRTIAMATSFLVIVALAVNPFNQQLLRYESHPVAVGNASVPRATEYDAYITNGIRAVKTVNLAAKSTYFNGLYNHGIPSLYDTKPTCTTGNCTWPDFSSLGVCSTCIDLTSSVKKDCKTTTNPVFCNYTVTDDNLYINTTGGNSYSVNAARAIKPVAGMPRYNNSLAMFNIIYNPSETRGANASACNLYFCVKTFRVEVKSGNLSETIISTFPNASTPNLDAKISLKGEKGTNSEAYPSLTLTPGPEDGVIGGPWPVHGMAYESMRSFLSQTFVGSVRTEPGMHIYSSDTMQVIHTAVTPGAYPVAGPSLENVMNGIATSLTNGISTDPASKGSTTVEGTAWQNTIFVRVVWGWIVLPGAVWVLALLMLVAVIWQTASKGVYAYKTDSLATVFAGLAEGRRSEVAHRTDTAKGRTKAAERMTVVLRRGGDGEDRLS